MRIMVIALVAFAATMGIARADTDRFQNIRREPRSDAQLDADSAYCQSKTGENSNGKRTSLPFKRCMLTRGWKYLRTAREGGDGQWWDPDQNLCRPCENSANGRISLLGGRAFAKIPRA